MLFEEVVELAFIDKIGIPFVQGGVTRVAVFCYLVESIVTIKSEKQCKLVSAED